MRLRSWPGSSLFCAFQSCLRTLNWTASESSYSTSLASFLDNSCLTVIFLNIWTSFTLESAGSPPKSLWQLVKLAWSPQAGSSWLYSQLCSSADGGERCGSSFLEIQWDKGASWIQIPMNLGSVLCGGGYWRCPAETWRAVHVLAELAVLHRGSGASLSSHT